MSPKPNKKDTPERDALKKQAARKFAPLVVGKTVKRVRYMTDDEMEDCMWYACAFVIEFTDGSWIAPMADDEGNNAGALMTSDKDHGTIYVI